MILSRQIYEVTLHQHAPKETSEVFLIAARVGYLLSTFCKTLFSATA